MDGTGAAGVNDVPLYADPVFWAVALVGVGVSGVSKGGFGASAGFAGTPVLALASSPTEALAVMLPLLALMDLTGLYAYRGSWDLRHATPLILAGALGIGAGALLFQSIDEAAIQLLIGGTALGFLVLRLLPKRGAPAQPPPERAASRRSLSALVFGGAAGFTSMVANAGGPLVAMHLTPLRLPKTTYQGTITLFFGVMNAIKFPAFFAVGLFTAETAITSLLLAPIAFGYVLIGVWAHNRVSQDAFYRVVLTLVAITSAKLIWDGVSALMA